MDPLPAQPGPPPRIKGGCGGEAWGHPEHERGAATAACHHGGPTRGNPHRLPSGPIGPSLPAGLVSGFGRHVTRGVILTVRSASTTRPVEHSMVVDRRDQLWEKTFQTYYDAYFEEIFAEKIIRRWQTADEITKVMFALTASGTAVSGWALWTTPHFRAAWAVLAGLAAVLSIVSLALTVPNRVNEWSNTRQVFARLRVDLETLRYRMEVDPEFSIDDFTGTFVKHRERYAECIEARKNDILGTDGLRNRAQDELDKRVSQEIIEEGDTQRNGQETQKGRTAATTTEATPPSEGTAETEEKTG